MQENLREAPARITVAVEGSDVTPLDFGRDARMAGIYAARMNLMGHRTTTKLHFEDGDTCVLSGPWGPRGAA